MNIRKKRWKAKPIKIRRISAPKRLRETRLHRKSKNERSVGQTIKKFFLALIALFCIGFASLFALFFVYSKNLPDVEQLKTNSLMIAQTTKIFDRTGTHLLYTIHGEEDRTSIPLAEIPSHVKWATLAVEDKNFYSRELAVDINGIGRALIDVLKNRNLSGQGGSTLTQQLVKNLILTRAKQLDRKVKEIILANRMEKNFSKDEILEMYLNQIPYGSNAYGIESAANTFFAKSARDLTLAEAALLAGLPKAPTYFSPYGNNREDLVARQKLILKLMLSQGYIGEEEYNRAKEEKLEFKSRLTNISAPHFVLYVRELLAQKYGENEIEQGGLRVTTTLNYDMQKIAEDAVKKGAEKNAKTFNIHNAALVALDPKTGQILSMVGSKDYFDEKEDGNVNVTLRPRQPGSSFKPIIYATAISKGYTPNTLLYDVQTNFSAQKNAKTPYIPKNFSLKYAGPIPMRNALAGSLNIPAVKTLYLASVNAVIAQAQKLGYTTFGAAEKCGLALALGCVEVTPLEHAAAIGALATGGVHHLPQAILKIEDESGAVLESFTDISAQALDAKTAHTITNILSDDSARAFIFGKGSTLTLKDRPVAAKTGTTDNAIDTWAVGFTPSLVAVVWSGNNNNDQKIKGNADGVTVAAPLWNEFMSRALEGTPPESFLDVEDALTGIAILDGRKIFERTLQIDTVSGKLATSYTPQDKIKEVVFEEHHSILHYLKKETPRATPLGYDPKTDPQYENWEQGVQTWLQNKAKEEGKNSVNAVPPTEYDDVHIPENKPEIEIIFPPSESVLTGDSMHVETHVTARRPLEKVEYLLNGNFRESAGFKPYDRTIFFGGLPDGAHVITVRAFDDAGNEGKRDVVFTLERGISAESPFLNPGAQIQKATPQLSWVNIKHESALLPAAFPFELQLMLKNPQSARRLNVYYDSENNIPHFIDGVKDPDTEDIRIIWKDPPEAGAYRLYTIIISENGNSYTSPEIAVTIE